MNNEPTQPHVLLVEDEHSIRRLWIDELEDDARYTVTGAAGADAAIAVLSTTAVDVAVIDIGLPEMSGEALIAIARTIDPRLPILAVTGFDANNYRHLRDLGIGVLQKPFRTSWLLFNLNALLTRHDHGDRRLVATMRPAALG